MYWLKVLLSNLDKSYTKMLKFKKRPMLTCKFTPIDLRMLILYLLQHVFRTIC